MSRVEAIADPAKLAIVRWLAECPAASAGEIAVGVGIHLNTARAKLAALHRAGIVERFSDSRGRRGRPTVRYRVVSGWAPRGDELLVLARVLAESIVDADTDPGGLYEAAFRWGQRQRAAGPDATPASLEQAMGSLGFSASFVEDRMTLSSCPCPLVCPRRPQLVCGIADAVADGVLAGSETAVVNREHDPVARSCSAILAAP